MTISMENEYVDLMKYLEEEHEIDSVEELFGMLDEHQQILAFPLQAEQLMKRAKEEHLDLIFHVFSDKTDVFMGWYMDALARYLVLRAQDVSNIRLYYQLYTRRELDEMVEENHMIGYGGFPD